MVGEHDEHRVVELTGAFHRVDDPTELPVDPARHPVVRGNDLGEIFAREVVPAVGGAQRFHESRFSGRGLWRDRLRNECTIVEREPRLLDGERRVREHERDPHEPRLSRRSSFVEPLLGGADRRLVGVDHDLLAARSEIEPTGEAIGDRGAVPQRTGLRRHEIAAEIGACLGDTRREDVAAMAGDGDVVTRVAHDAEQVRLPRLQEVRQRPVAGHVRIPPGHQRHPARTTHRVLAECIREPHAALASASMLGVRLPALSKHPSASARNWSGMNSTTFGRPGTAAPYDVVTDPAVLPPATSRCERDEPGDRLDLDPRGRRDQRRCRAGVRESERDGVQRWQQLEGIVRLHRGSEPPEGELREGDDIVLSCAPQRVVGRVLDIEQKMADEDLHLRVGRYY